MNRIKALIIAGFIVYTGLLLVVELRTSQDYVRHYFTDIEGPVPFYAVNTTLSATLLWATALLFAVGWYAGRNVTGRSRLCWFFASQAFVFAWLGIDDRFKAHEHLAWRAGLPDHYMLLAVAALEGMFLLVLGRPEVLQRRPMQYLIAASALFGVMLFFDAMVPHDMLLRLSIEDLAKTWASLCFCGFAWQLVSVQIDELKSHCTQAVPVPRADSTRAVAPVGRKPYLA